MMRLNGRGVLSRRPDTPGPPCRVAEALPRKHRTRRSVPSVVGIVVQQATIAGIAARPWPRRQWDRRSTVDPDGQGRYRCLAGNTPGRGAFAAQLRPLVRAGRTHAADRAARGDLGSAARGHVRSLSGVSVAVRADRAARTLLRTDWVWTPRLPTYGVARSGLDALQDAGYDRCSMLPDWARDQEAPWSSVPGRQHALVEGRSQPNSAAQLRSPTPPPGPLRPAGTTRAQRVGCLRQVAGVDVNVSGPTTPPACRPRRARRRRRSSRRRRRRASTPPP